MGVKVSVIVPAYNSERYLKECVDSILNSTLQDIEIILVDDGSTDQTPELCDSYARKFDKIRVIHQENKGQNAARLAGTTIANGDYIGFVDSDDWIDPKMYEELWQQAYIENADMVCCGCIYEKGNYQEIRYNVLQEGVYHRKAILQEILPNVVSLAIDYAKGRPVEPHLVDKLFRKEFILQELFSIDKHILWDEDALITFRCIAKGNVIVVVRTAPYHYRIHQDSILRGHDERAVFSYPILLQNFLEYCSENNINAEQRKYYVIAAIRDMLRIGLNVPSSKFWQFPYNDFEKGQQVVIYGAGEVGCCYYNQVKKSGYFAEIIWTDSNAEKSKSDNRIYKADEAFKIEYDKVVIAVEKEYIAMEIKQQLLEKFIPLEKIYWKEPVCVPDTFTFGMK